MSALRGYQIEAIERVRTAWNQGRRRVVLASPTGSGKTVIAGEMVRRAVANGKRALFLAHRAELVDQACAALAEFGLTVGARCATASTPPNPYAPVQVASVQTLLARNERPPADLIIADEAHHFADAAETWIELLRHYASAYIVGPTATPQRGDGCGLRGMFDTIVVAASVRELTDAGHLVPCEIMRPEKMLAPGQIAQSPVDAYVEHANGRRAIVFARSVPLAEEYAGEFTMRGIAARTIHADTPWAERRMYLDAFARGAIRVLTNVYVLTEGFDDPGVSCCILARGCGSAGMYLQMIGRILRPAEGKRDAVLIDLRGVSHEHGRPEDSREYSLDGVGIRLRDPNSYCPVCGAPKEPGEPCAACGYVPSGEDSTKPDNVTGDAIKPWMRLRETDDSDKRAERLARWIAASRAKGYRDGYWKAKFNAVYGSWPVGDVLQKALALLGRESAA